MSTTTSREFIRSVCGQYFAKACEESHTTYALYDGTGKYLGKTTWWSNQSTETRIAFEIGVGTHYATFGYPRRPSWFKRRWVECFEIELSDLAELAKQCGCKVLVGYKPDLNCWHHLGLKCTKESLAAFDTALKSRGLPFLARPKGGQWGIECPLEHRQLRLRRLPSAL